MFELHDLKFEGWLAFHNYNEPLANPRIFDELREAKSILPTAAISIFTNGDYLTFETLRALCLIGVSYLRIMVYPPAGEAIALVSNHEIQENRLMRWLRNRGLNSITRWRTTDVRQGTAMVSHIEQLRIEAIAPDLRNYNWRGATAPSIPGSERQLPCYMTSHSASIDYLGRLKMCCNVFADIPEHASYVVGNLRNFSFAELWFSEKLKSWRRAHKDANWTNLSICTRCTQKLPDNETELLKHEEA